MSEALAAPGGPAGASQQHPPLGRRGYPAETTAVFLSGVTSVAHLAYVSTYLAWHLARTTTTVDLVDFGVVRFLGAPRVTAADYERLLPRSPRLRLRLAAAERILRLSSGRLGRPLYISVGAPGIKAYLRLLRASRRRPWCVVVDEGLGSYGTWRSRWAAARRQGGHGIRALGRALASSLAKRWLTDEHWCLYRRTGPRWELDPRAAAAFRRDEEPPRARESQRWVLWVSQPWIELGKVDEQRYLDLLKLLGRHCDLLGLTLRVRPHPAEDAARYADFDVHRAPGPLELDPEVRTAAAILGLNSTALVNLSALHRLPVWRVRLPELDGIERGLSRRQRELLTQFVPPPVQLGEIPDLLRQVSEGAARAVHDAQRS